MFGYRRRPFFPGALLLFGLGFVVATAVGGAGSVAGAILFLPLLALKLLFFFFLFGMLMRVVGHGWGGPGRGGPGWGGPGWGGPRGPRRGGRRRGRPEERREPTEEEREWAKARRDAQEEIDELFPDPREW